MKKPNESYSFTSLPTLIVGTITLLPKILFYCLIGGYVTVIIERQPKKK